MTNQYPYATGRPEDTEASAEEVQQLAELLQQVHNESNIDGYGDEGAGYDFEKQARALLASDWLQNKIKGL